MNSDLTEIRRYLNVAKRAISLMEARLNSLEGDGLLNEMMQEEFRPQPQLVNPVPTLIPTAVPHIGKQPIVTQTVVQPAPEPTKPVGPSPEEIKEFVIVRQKHIQDLMAIDCWPEAVPEFLVALASEKDQINRANCVLDMMIDRSIEGTRFLDYGCGEGWIVQETLKRGVCESWGYDISPSDNWQKLEGTFTSNPDDLKQDYYDVIMLYDVLDHAVDPIAVMNHVRRLLKPTGTVYVRCHPWTSKHALHLYKHGVNKAFFHLFLSWDELVPLTSGPLNFTRQEKSPIEAYHWWFNEFEIKRRRDINADVSPFFYVQSFKELLASEQQIPLEKIDDFLKLMKIEFLDFTLVPKG